MPLDLSRKGNRPPLLPKLITVAFSAGLGATGYALIGPPLLSPANAEDSQITAQALMPSDPDAGQDVISDPVAEAMASSATQEVEAFPQPEPAVSCPASAPEPEPVVQRVAFSEVPGGTSLPADIPYSLGRYVIPDPHGALDLLRLSLLNNAR